MEKNMKIVFLDSLALGEGLDLDSFRDIGEVEIYPSSNESEIIERIANCDVAITNKLKLNRGNLENASNLKLICVTATGFDNIDVAYAKERGIAVCNVVGYSTTNVAQLTAGFVLQLINKSNQSRKLFGREGNCACILFLFV